MLNHVVSSRHLFELNRRWVVQERSEVCLAEEVERLRREGLSDEEVASRLGVDVGWVETLISPGEDEVTPNEASAGPKA